MEIIRYRFSSLPSTQDRAKENRKKFDPGALTIISAEEQTKGRGRFDKSWFSPKGGNLYITCYFTLESCPFPKEPITFLPALAIAEVLQKLGLQPKIKWPNDLLIGDKKIAGILTEMQTEEEVTHVFLGYGLNVNMDENLLRSLENPATSVRVETKKEWSPRTLQEQIEKILLRDLTVFKEKGFTPFYPDLVSLSFTEERSVILDTGREQIEGIYRGITPEGGLKIRLPDNKEKVFFSGILRFKNNG